MTTRRAIKRKTEILAECPRGSGLCRWDGGGDGRWLSCGFFRGTIDSGNGLMVRCGYKTGGARHAVPVLCMVRE